jgi:hypothetical protein
MLNNIYLVVVLKTGGKRKFTTKTTKIHKDCFFVLPCLWLAGLFALATKLRVLKKQFTTKTTKVHKDFFPDKSPTLSVEQAKLIKKICWLPKPKIALNKLNPTKNPLWVSVGSSNAVAGG